MKRIYLYVAGIVVALIPAVLGLTGNASFSQSVPVRVPDRVSSDETPTPTPTPTPRPGSTPTHDAADDRGRGGTDDGPTHDANDDRGGDHHFFACHAGQTRQSGDRQPSILGGR